MSIPDHISPIVAYRVWQWDSLGLKSLNNQQWFPGCALEANTSRCRREHAAPKEGCTCGVYAAQNFVHLQSIGLETLIAYGAGISLAARRSGLDGKEGSIRLWSKESGLDMAGFDWLIEKRKRWYRRSEFDWTPESRPSAKVAANRRRRGRKSAATRRRLSRLLKQRWAQGKMERKKVRDL